MFSAFYFTLTSFPMYSTHNENFIYMTVRVTVTDDHSGVRMRGLKGNSDWIFLFSYDKGLTDYCTLDLLLLDISCFFKHACMLQMPYTK